MTIKKVRMNERSEIVKTCRDSGLTVQQWCSNKAHQNTVFYGECADYNKN